MFAVYIAVTTVAAVADAWAAVLNFNHHRSIVEVAERLGVPLSWQLPLGTLLATGWLGLLAGFVIHLVGTAAACGLVAYFLGAAVAHIRARDTRVGSWANWAVFFALAVSSLVLGLMYRGPS